MTSTCQFVFDSVQETSPIQDLPPEVRRQFMKTGMVGLGDSYVRGEWDIEPLGDFLYRLVVSNPPGPGKLNLRLVLQYLDYRLRNRQTGHRVFEVAKRHYDLGNDLFAAMLDPSMSYTCGYWKNAHSLAEAQEGKLSIICEKLDLKRGMSVLDIGCGWGNFAQFSARRYGVHVTGITISKEQFTLAKERCRDLPVRIELEDYRSIEGRFDRVVSIEMIEAVGKLNIPTFFRSVHRLLKPGGRFLLQTISTPSFSRSSTVLGDQFLVWLVRNIFPNGYVPNMQELTKSCGSLFTLEHAEQLGMDYARTLAAWEKNIEDAWPELEHHYSKEFRRMWRYYLAGCRVFFMARIAQLYQLTYTVRPHPRTLETGGSEKLL